MKKQILIAPLVLFLSSCEQQETTNQQEVNNKQEEVSTQVAVREVKQSQLVKRDSLFYVGDEETPFTGKFTGNHKNGQLRIEGGYVNGQRDGLFRNWDEDGQLTSEKTFVNGKPIK